MKAAFFIASLTGLFLGLSASASAATGTPEALPPLTKVKSIRSELFRSQLLKICDDAAGQMQALLLDGGIRPGTTKKHISERGNTFVSVYSKLFAVFRRDLNAQLTWKLINVLREIGRRNSYNLILDDTEADLVEMVHLWQQAIQDIRSCVNSPPVPASANARRQP
jgi:hypothetical protein